jgi:hypothetical protein
MSSQTTQSKLDETFIEDTGDTVQITVAVR